MTMTEPLVHRPDGWWTIDDLDRLPDDGMRYELVDGSLLVSPAPTPRHGRVVHRLRRLLDRQAPADLAVSNDVGVAIGGQHTYLVPDLFVIPETSFEDHPRFLLPHNLMLAVEVLSEHNRGRDLVLKRHYYASVAIASYWIVDPFERTITVLGLAGKEYVEKAIVTAGTTWRTDEPFPLEFDPAVVFPA